MVSSIYTAQNNGIMSDIWKFNSNFQVAFTSTMLILFFLIIFNNYIIIGLLDFFIIKIINLHSYNLILNIFIYITFPIMLFNYFKFLHKNKYIEFIKSYKSNYNKKLFIIFFITCLLFGISIIFLNPNPNPSYKSYLIVGQLLQVL
jgi:hypothetical protein